MSIVLFLLPPLMVCLGVFLVLGTVTFLIFEVFEEYLRNRGEI